MTKQDLKPEVEYTVDADAKMARVLASSIFFIMWSVVTGYYGNIPPHWMTVQLLSMSIGIYYFLYFVGVWTLAVKLGVEFHGERCDCDDTDIIELPPEAPQRNLMAFSSPVQESLVVQNKVSGSVDLFEVFREENREGLVKVSELIKRTEMLNRRGDELQLKRPSVRGIDLEDTKLEDLGDVSLYGIVENGSGNKNYSNFLKKMRDVGFVTGSSNYPKLTNRYYAYCTKVCFENDW